MNVTPVSAVNNQPVNYVEPLKKEVEQPSVEGYEEQQPAPTNADLYKSLYGVKEEKSYAEQMADYRAKYELDVNDQNKEVAPAETQETENTEEKSYYEQYLEYKHKYE